MSEETQSEVAVSTEAAEATQTETTTKAKMPTWGQVKELRLEAAENRVAASKLEKQLADAEKDFQERLAAREAEVRTEAQAEARKEVAVSRLEALATKAGLLDPDLVSLIDASAIEFDDNGKMKNGQELIDAFKASKPNLFAAQATSSVAKTPTAISEAKKATDMTDEEYRAYKLSKGLSL
ncbi:hypothetical protein D3C86_1214060 [compost metagenome]